jgi:FkbM family methyltransferase
MANAIEEGIRGNNDLGDQWLSPYEVLRNKWGTVPLDAETRIESSDLLTMPDRDLLALWHRAYNGTSTGLFYGIRGWYHDLYRDKLRGHKILDVGCGLAVSSLHFAEHGARVTFADIVEDNLRVVERICALKGIAGEFFYIQDDRSFERLAYGFDAVLAIGSLLNAPEKVTRAEIQMLLPHLNAGGRWLHLAYPKSRWIRDGMPLFSQWGELTDGPGTPWMEYHDWEKMLYFFAPAKIALVFSCEWHNNDFNWFDLVIHHKSNAAERIALSSPMPTEDTMASDFSVFRSPKRCASTARARSISLLSVSSFTARVCSKSGPASVCTRLFLRSEAATFSALMGTRSTLPRCCSFIRIASSACCISIGAASLADLGSFDIVYCYGTLYHLQDPDGALARLARVCRGQILVETLVVPGSYPELHRVVEPLSANQGICGIGTRPTRSWVMSALRRNFGHAYATLDQPDFPDFVTDWQMIAHDGNLRAVFVGSKYPIQSPALTAVLPVQHRNASVLAPPPQPSRVWIDVGAYGGEASRQAALDDVSLMVHAFEPVPALFEELNRGPKNYRVHAMAVSDRNGSALFRLNAFVAASSLLPLDEAARLAWTDGHLLVEEREIIVPTIRLDTFMDGAGITAVEFLKVDTQGADFQVVSSAGTRLKDIRKIKLEVAITARQLYLGAADKATVTTFLEAEGFRLIETERQSHNQEENLTFAR